jgi:hypothetical protein
MTVEAHICSNRVSSSIIFNFARFSSQATSELWESPSYLVDMLFSILSNSDMILKF